MEGTTRAKGRDHRRHLLVLSAVATFLAADSFHHPARAIVRTALSSQASPSGFPVGNSIFGSATLGYGLNPTGTITFRLYGPSDPTCGAAPIFTSSVPVRGNGYHASGFYLAQTAGTYRWTAAYSGDFLNSPAGPTLCGAASAAVAVAKRVPTLSGRSSLVGVGGPTANTATLNGGGPSGPTGTLTFSLYGPNNLTCAGAPAFATSRTVGGNGSYTSASFKPPTAGTYQWIVSYGGDANNYGASTVCADSANSVVISTGTTAGVTLAVTPTTVSPSTNLTVTWSGIAQPTSADWVALYAVGAADSATKTWRYTTGAAAGSVVLTVPWGTPPGSYEVRLFANNSTVRLATAPFTVA